MQITDQDLLRNYQGMDNDKLLSLYTNGALTEKAYMIIERVMTERELKIPERPDQYSGQANKISLNDAVSLYHNGKRSLKNSYLLFGILGRFVAAMILGLFYITTRNDFVLSLASILLGLYLFYSSIIILRCSNNTDCLIFKLYAKTDSFSSIAASILLIISSVIILV